MKPLRNFLLAVAALGYAAIIGHIIRDRPPRTDVAAILVVPCDAVQRVVIFTHPDGTWDSVIPAFPPSRELIQRLERTKRSQINLPCTQETLNVQIR